MTNPIEQVVEFTYKSGLMSTPEPKKEAAYQIEEALEDFDLSKLSSLVSPSEETLSPKELSRKIMNIATWEGTPDISEVKQLDKALDHVVYGLGNMAKLNLDAEGITKALNIVMEANLSKIGCPLDSEGKLTKPKNFEELYAPEPKLAELLAGIKKAT